jgi:hypothetical protein
MITNFESITVELTDDEKTLLEPLIKGFKCHSKVNPITEKKITIAMNTFIRNQTDMKILFTGTRLRKFVNYIRVNSLIPLIATNNGYFVSYEKSEIELAVKSLYERSASINSAADGLSQYLTGECRQP